MSNFSSPFQNYFKIPVGNSLNELMFFPIAKLAPHFLLLSFFLRYNNTQQLRL